LIVNAANPTSAAGSATQRGSAMLSGGYGTRIAPANPNNGPMAASGQNILATHGEGFYAKTPRNRNWRNSPQVQFLQQFSSTLIDCGTIRF